MNYKQCQLNHPDTRRTDVVWIPTQFAVQGKRLQVRPTPEADFEDGWVVAEVYLTVWTQDDANNARKNQKRFDEVLGG
jgi:hypothetical protein